MTTVRVWKNRVKRQLVLMKGNILKKPNFASHTKVVLGGGAWMAYLLHCAFTSHPTIKTSDCSLGLNWASLIASLQTIEAGLVRD